MERITERNYTLVSLKYEKEQIEIDTRLEQISNEIVNKTEQGKNISDFISLIKSY